jgi:hypothetical protein
MDVEIQVWAVKCRGLAEIRLLECPIRQAITLDNEEVGLISCNWGFSDLKL